MTLLKLLYKRRYPQAVGFVTELLLGWDLYIEALRRRSPDQYVRRTLPIGTMVLNLDDVGISRNLLRYGTHERTSSAAYRRELDRLKDDVSGDIRVLELGANLGYFLLTAATVLEERGRFYAVEPHPTNQRLLRENVDRNDLSSQTEFIDGGVGSASRSAVLNVMPQSNWHTVAPVTKAGLEPVATVDIELLSVDTLLDRLELTPADVHVVRFDIENYEQEVFAGMQRLLDADTPLLLYVEFHLPGLEAASARHMLHALDESGLEIVSAVALGETRYDSIPLNVVQFRDLWKYQSWSGLEVIARREGTRDSNDDTTANE